MDSAGFKPTSLVRVAICSSHLIQIFQARKTIDVQAYNQLKRIRAGEAASWVPLGTMDCSLCCLSEAELGEEGAVMVRSRFKSGKAHVLSPRRLAASDN